MTPEEKSEFEEDVMDCYPGYRERGILYYKLQFGSCDGCRTFKDLSNDEPTSGYCPLCSAEGYYDHPMIHKDDCDLKFLNKVNKKWQKVSK